MIRDLDDNAAMGAHEAAHEEREEGEVLSGGGWEDLRISWLLGARGISKVCKWSELQPERKELRTFRRVLDATNSPSVALVRPVSRVER